MYTQCPKCATVFRITAVQLRVAEGEVRCGSCTISFNALLSLSDDLPELTDAVIDNEPDSQIAVLDTQHRPQDDEQPPENADRTLEFPPGAMRMKRGKKSRTQKVALPEGYLDDRLDATPPEAETTDSGG